MAGILAPETLASRALACPGRPKAPRRRRYPSCPPAKRVTETQRVQPGAGRGEENPSPGPSSQPGAQSTAGCAPSFLCTPLCHHGKPPRGPVHSRSAPGRQGLLGVLGSRQKDAGQAWGGRMPLTQWGPRGQGCGERRRVRRWKAGVWVWGSINCGPIGPYLGRPEFNYCRLSWVHALGQASSSL